MVKESDEHIIATHRCRQCVLVVHSISSEAPKNHLEKRGKEGGKRKRQRDEGRDEEWGEGEVRGGERRGGEVECERSREKRRGEEGSGRREDKGRKEGEEDVARPFHPPAFHRTQPSPDHPPPPVQFLHWQTAMAAPPGAISFECKSSYLDLDIMVQCAQRLSPSMWAASK